MKGFLLVLGLVLCMALLLPGVPMVVHTANSLM